MTRDGRSDSRTLHCAIAQALPLPLVIGDRKTLFACNEAFADFFGAESPAQMRGMPMDSLLHEDSRDGAAERRAVITATRHRIAGSSAKMVTLDGTVRNVVLEGWPLTAGIGTFMGASVSCAEHSFSPLAVRPQPDPLLGELAEGLLEGLPMPVMVHDAGLAVYLNPAALKMMGAEKPEQIVGKSFAEFVHPDAVDAGAQRRAMMGAVEMLRDVVLKLVALDGTPRYVRCAARAFEWDGRQHIVIGCRKVASTPGELGAG